MKHISGLFVLDSSKITWHVSESSERQDDGVTIYFAISPGDSQKDALRQLAQNLKQDGAVWLKPVKSATEQWLLDADELRRTFDILQASTWLQGKVEIRPECNIAEQKFSRSKAEIRFLVYPDELQSISQDTVDTVPTLRVFLCHASNDKPAVRELYRRLCTDGFSPWLDEEDLLPGQDWQYEIPKAVRQSDVVIVCLSPKSSNKEGYVQKEIKFALDAADEKPEGTIFIVPLKLEECVVPDRLSRWQWVNQFEANGYARLVRTLRKRAADLNVSATIAVSTPLAPATHNPSVSNVSGGVNLEANDVVVGQDMVGRDKVVSAGGHIIHAGSGATVIINGHPTSSTEERTAREQVEQDRLARESAEAERIAQEKTEEERLTHERAEQERLAALKIEEERISPDAEQAAIVNRTNSVRNLLGVSRILMPILAPRVMNWFLLVGGVFILVGLIEMLQSPQQPILVIVPIVIGVLILLLTSRNLRKR